MTRLFTTSIDVTARPRSRRAARRRAAACRSECRAPAVLETVARQRVLNALR